ncbi:MAG: hypothetical protein Q8941_12275 [Bacteroidota bacterium]|nr:hypothetical protein [Bacteroidota bacterium]
MKLKFFDPEKLDRNLKATAHRSGKLGFTVEAARKLSLSVDKSAGIAINEEDQHDRSLYVIIYPNKQDGAFKISKAGLYYYINTKALFDTLRIDYKNDWVVYDISKEVIDNQDVFKFVRREKTKKDAEKIENNN